MNEVLVLVIIKNGLKMSMSVLPSKAFEDEIKPGKKFLKKIGEKIIGCFKFVAQMNN